MQNNDIAERLMLPVPIVTKRRRRYYHEGGAGLDEHLAHSRALPLARHWDPRPT